MIRQNRVARIFISDGISSRSSNFLDHYSNSSAYDINEATLAIDTTTKSSQNYGTNTKPTTQGECVWQWEWECEPEYSYYSQQYYQKAQPRQGFLALLNPSTLVSEVIKSNPH